MVSISTKDKWEAITTDLYDRIKKGTGVDFFKEAVYDTEDFADYIQQTLEEKESREYNRSDRHIWAHLSSIIERPDKYQDFYTIYQLKERLDLEGPISEIIEEVYDKYQPDRPQEEIDWEKRQPKFDDNWKEKGQEYGGKKWDKWYEEGQDKGFDL